MQRLKLPRRSEIRAEQRDDLFDGIVTLAADAMRLDDRRLGRTRSIAPSRPPRQPATLTALPYYLWNNREKGSMMVWLAEA